MILGSFISELTALGLYPQQETGTTLQMSVATLRARLKKFQISTYDTHDYAEMAKYDGKEDHDENPVLGDTRGSLSKMNRKKNGLSFNHTLPVFGTSDPRDRNYYLGHGIVSHAQCAESLNLSGLPAKIVSEMPSPVLESHRRHMELQAKK